LQASESRRTARVGMTAVFAVCALFGTVTPVDAQIDITGSWGPRLHEGVSRKCSCQARAGSWLTGDPRVVQFGMNGGFSNREGVT
jgi:hypothetical protein